MSQQQIMIKIGFNSSLNICNKRIVEFSIPREITKNGTLLLTFSCAQKVDGEAERGTQVAEIWLIKKGNKSLTYSLLDYFNGLTMMSL